MTDDLDIREQIIERAAEKVARQMRGIVGPRMYPPDEAAELLSLLSERGGRTIREIPQSELPLIPILPGGKTKGYLGFDLLRYLRRQRKAAKRRAG